MGDHLTFQYLGKAALIPKNSKHFERKRDEDEEEDEDEAEEEENEEEEEDIWQ